MYLLFHNLYSGRIHRVRNTENEYWCASNNIVSIVWRVCCIYLVSMQYVCVLPAFQLVCICSLKAFPQDML